MYFSNLVLFGIIKTFSFWSQRMRKIKTLIYLLLFCCSTFAFSDEEAMPRTVDLGKMHPSCIPGYEDMDLDFLAEEYRPFQGAMELCPYFRYLLTSFNLDAAIETGSGTGETTAFLAFLFNRVNTMDNEVTVFNKACKYLQAYSNATAHFGNSPDILRHILPSKKNDRLLFYLDAYSKTAKRGPLLEELELISKTHRDNCIIVVNGIKVPGRNDIPYRTYGKSDCSYDYIKPLLNQIFSGYVCYYIIPKSPHLGAQLVVIPRTKTFSSGWAP